MDSLKEYFEAINGISLHSGEEEIISIKKGLKRTGKSCRLRWKNYLRPNVRRGNFTLEEQFLIIELQCLFGNRWSKIAECFPGRTDNEIKNYWRTRVQKHAKQLKYDVNSNEFREFIRNIWLPKLSEQIHASKCKNLDDVCMGSSDNTGGSKEFQMDYGAAATEIIKPNQVSEMDDYLFMSSDFGQDYSPYIGYGFQGIETPISWFDSGDLYDMLLIDDYLWV